MIARETQKEFVMTSQHDHAILSGEMAKQFRPELFIDTAYRDDVLLAITQHDRGWLGLDENPIWDDRSHVPFSFSEYPLFPKLPAYIRGIDEVEEMSPYAALVCSLHYCSFTQIRESSHPECAAYIQHELSRQAKLRAQLPPLNEEVVHRHFQLLQFCDGLSLYVCMVDSRPEQNVNQTWFKKGTNSPVGRDTYKAKWINEREILIDLFPFEESAQFALDTRYVSKASREELGVDQAYWQTPESRIEFTFVKS
ncbi:DUF3891 family protein [Paenibacillus sp. JX-17]|uniref:DUF3891 family protein n=1 Tax=Paenibacillus lacisoli TaxID=3064525 RepID=A0ABT9CK18_9BACL|nr:DUF3891 family protein [Paenibacillus sp. JX-17]MDO7908006.1 DUF3891 family protein [Paenibacillus sp. JX-17]